MKKNIKRLMSFMKGKYHLMILSICMVVLIQVLEFASPLIVKGILDNGILGLEGSWSLVESKDQKTVEIHGAYYKQKEFLDSDDVILEEYTLILYKNEYYLVEGAIESGSKKIEGSQLIITSLDKTEYTYSYYKLSTGEYVACYVPIYSKIVLLLGLLFLKLIIVIVASYIAQLSINRVITKILMEVRTKAMQNIERLPMRYFESEPAGKIASKITADVDGFSGFYRQIFNIFLNAVLSFILSYVGMFILNVKLALCTFLIYPFVFIWVRFFVKRLNKYAVKVNESRSMLTAKINEIINGINILQIFNFKDKTIREFNETSTIYKDEQMKEVKLHITLGWNMINIVRAAITAFVVGYFGWQYLNVYGVVISAGLIYAYNQYLLKIIDPVYIILMRIGDFQHAQVKMNRISTILEAEIEDDTVFPVERYKGDIKFDNIWFSYVEGDYVLKGVSFDIKPGQFIGLVGNTGSGKSSLMNLLLRFYDITDSHSGQIYMDGKNISELPKRAYREHIGIVLQEPVLFRGDIASNVRFGKENITDEQIEQTLKMLGGERFLSKFKDGIHERIGRNGGNMSSGEKQIISLARVFIYDPAVLIMDEATSHIDTETEAMIQNALSIVCKNRTVIVIAHRLSTIFNADKIIVLQNGLKVEEGTHAELLNNNSVYANIYRSQAVNIK